MYTCNLCPGEKVADAGVARQPSLLDHSQLSERPSLKIKRGPARPADKKLVQDLGLIPRTNMGESQLISSVMPNQSCPPPSARIHMHIITCTHVYREGLLSTFTRFVYAYECFACMFVYVPCFSGACGQRRASDSLVTHHLGAGKQTWVLC